MHPLDAKKEAMKAMNEADRLADLLDRRATDEQAELIRELIAALHLAMDRLIDC